MNTMKNLTFCLVLLGVFVFLPTPEASAEEGRYFVKTNKSFWKNTLGVRHNFEDGFTTDLSDFQVKFNRLLGLEIEPVKALQILPSDVVDQKAKQILEEVKDNLPNISPGPVLDQEAKKQVVVPSRVQKNQRIVPTDQTPWGVEKIYNDSGLLATTGGGNVNVAVLDTGVYINHPDLKNRISQCKDFTNYRTPIVNGKCDDKIGHGTHIAGIIAADAGADGKGLYGIAPASKIFAYKICNQNGSCYADDVATAIRTAADQGANVLNLSIGADSEIPMVTSAVNYASTKGVLIVAASGNDGPFTNSIDYPAVLSEIIGVGALNQSLLVTNWSSRGNNAYTSPFVVENGDIEFAAPGENIESAYNNGGYAILSGTSMAAPFVSGMAAKFWQINADNPAQATRDVLHSLAQDILPLGDDNASGFGIPIVPAQIE